MTGIRGITAVYYPSRWRNWMMPYYDWISNRADQLFLMEELFSFFVLLRVTHEVSQLEAQLIAAACNHGSQMHHGTNPRRTPSPSKRTYMYRLVTVFTDTLDQKVIIVA